MRQTGKWLLISMAALLVPALIGVGAVTGSLAAAQKKHAGTVEMVDRSAGTIVIEDIGRRLKSGKSEVHHVKVHVSPSAQFARAQRVAGPGPEGWIGAYAESPLPAWDVKKGDFAVVTMDGGKGVEVTVVDTRAP
jgi:FtsP/CotA-like multicopper oxidase with cupredoxin domain